MFKLCIVIRQLKNVWTVEIDTDQLDGIIQERVIPEFEIETGTIKANSDIDHLVKIAVNASLGCIKQLDDHDEVIGMVADFSSIMKLSIDSTSVEANVAFFNQELIFKNEVQRLIDEQMIHNGSLH